MTGLTVHSHYDENLDPDEADAVVSAVRITRKLMEQNKLGLENSDFMYKKLTSALYKLTEGAEGFIIKQ